MDLGGLIICRPTPLRFSATQALGFTLMSDLHLGAHNVDYHAIERELKTARENGDRIAINGDLFDMILSKDMKRFTPGVLHPRLARRNDLVNAAIEWAVELLSPYADLIDMIGIGNHEAAVEKYHSVDPTRLLIYELEKRLPRSLKSHRIHYGGYGGFLDYRFQWTNKQGQRPQGGSGSASKRLVIYYHHGWGGSAPITKGLIDFSRKGWVDADVIWMGHRHHRLTVSIQSVRCPIRGDEPTVEEVRHVQTGAYFQTYGGQSQASIRANGRRTNYAADMGLAPQGVGGARLLVRFGHSWSEPYEMQVIQ